MGVWRADGEKERPDRAPREHHKDVSHTATEAKSANSQLSPTDFGAFQLEQHAASRLFVGLRPLEGAQS